MNPQRPRGKFIRPYAGASGLLSAAYAVQILVPMAAAVYLGRTLGPAAWGDVAAALALGNLAVALPEFSFGFSATRAVAQAASPQERADVLRGTLGARGLLTAVAVLLVAVVVWLPGLPPEPGPLGYATLAYVAAHGIAFEWWFDGTKRFAHAAALTVLARLPVPLLLVLLVHGPSDAPWAVAAYALSGGLALLVGLGWTRREGGEGRMSRASVGRALRAGRTLFASRVGLLIYLNGTVYWLRLLAGPLAAGLYVPAEQAARAACMVLQPLSRVLLPALSAQDAAAHARSLRRVVGAYALLGLGLAGAVWIAAPLLPAFVGAEFAPSVPVLRLLAPLPLFVALSQAVAVQGLVARGRDRQLALSFLAGAVVCVAAMAAWVPPFGARGMAVAVVLAEATVALVAALLWQRKPGERRTSNDE